jgi:hypothetical protein
MNPIRAAAIVTLIATIGAAVYLVYQATAVRSKYESNLSQYTDCAAKRQTTTANWEQVQSQIGLFNAQGKYREALDFAKEHAGERPFFIGECGQFLDLRPPVYAWPSGIAVVGLITSLTLFGAAKAKGQ